MKLWGSTGTVDENEQAQKVAAFTVGADKYWDVRLAKYDVIGSQAHVQMLQEVGLLSATELEQILAGLQQIAAQIDAGTFEIEDGVEDVHSQVELMLTRLIGDAGKKIHSGRSRNDQSLTDIKLYLKDEIKAIAQSIGLLFDRLILLSERHKADLLPGYTHMQLAMPSSFGLWFGAWAESLADDMEALIAAYNVTDRNPLGSGAGYGSSFPLDRERTTELLAFGALNVNSVYAQMTRGKTERFVAAALASVAATLARMSADICMFMNQNMGFVTFAGNLLTGSSIMPHKKNPDVFELIRAKCNRIVAVPGELALLCGNLTSGYHRDMQLTKDCLFPAIDSLKDCLEMAVMMLDKIQIRKDILSEDTYDVLFTVEEVNKLVVAGMPFRDAYRQVSKSIETGTYTAEKNIRHTHIGSIGNLRNDLIVADFNQKLKKILPGD